MALRKILTKGDEQLAKHCRPVEKFDDRLHVLIDDMRETLENSGGRRPCRPAGRHSPPRRRAPRRQQGPGGDGRAGQPRGHRAARRGARRRGLPVCSGVYGYVTRPTWRRSSAQDRFGNWFEREGEGIVAQCFCHETEHLDGHLFIEKVEEYVDVEQMQDGEEE